MTVFRIGRKPGDHLPHSSFRPPLSLPQAPLNPDPQKKMGGLAGAEKENKWRRAPISPGAGGRQAGLEKLTGMTQAPSLLPHIFQAGPALKAGRA